MNKSLRFCFCTTFYPPFSRDADGEYVHQLANALARLGHDVTVVHSPDTFELLSGQQAPGPYSDHENVVIRRVFARLGKLGLLATHQTGHPVGMAA